MPFRLSQKTPLLPLHQKLCYSVLVKLFPKSCAGNGIAVFLSALWFLAFCGWGAPVWLAVAALLYGVANAILAVDHAFEDVFGPRDA